MRPNNLPSQAPAGDTGRDRSKSPEKPKGSAAAKDGAAEAEELQAMREHHPRG